MRQTTLEDFSQETIQCNGSLLSETAKNFREAYISVMIMEALALTVKEDEPTVIKELEDRYSKWTFREVAQQALLDGFIESMDDIYK